ncbi:hypothetical protein [Bacillus cereus]|uniref:hypothetical protein n=1 Tax=Bacillus cereus TaxID=1396 RepID=UPI001E2EE299|nr:hypothetical protein [Bacillus cereus]MCD2338394.1 hypothetical protein [Bacillus cereus]
MREEEYSLFYPDNDNRRSRVNQLVEQCKDLASIVNKKKNKINEELGTLGDFSKSLISAEIIQNYTVKDFFFTPKIIDWALEANWIGALVNEATQRSNYRKATKDFYKTRLKLKFMESMAKYIEELVISASKEVERTEAKAKLNNWSQEKIKREINDGIVSIITLTKELKGKPAAIETLKNLQDLDDMLKAWINEDPSVEELEDTMNELDALNSPKYEYQKNDGWYYSNGNAYYYEKNGKIKTGILIEAKRKYFLAKKDGAMLRNEWVVADDGKKYYFGKHGASKYGWFTYYGQWYYFGIDGSALTGWFYDKRKNYWYYFSPEFIPNVCSKAEMVRNTSLVIKTYQGPYKRFHFNKDGVCTNP